MAWNDGRQYQNLEAFYQMISALLTVPPEPPRRTSSFGFKTFMRHEQCFDHLHAVAYYASAVWPGRA